MTALPARMLRRHPQLTDAILAVAMTLELELEAWLDSSVPAPHRLITAVAAVLFAGPIAFRRRWPAGALIACAAVAACQAPLAGNILEGMTGTLIPPLILSYTAGARLGLRRGLSALLVAAALFTVGLILTSRIPEPGGYGGLAGALAGDLFLLAAPWLVARFLRERRRRAVAFAELAARVEQLRQQDERAATQAERNRIGRELHDVIAQTVSAIIVQAGGARQLIGSDPARASEAILAVERAGREALTDLRRTLGLLHEDDLPRSLAPAPGLAQLPALLAIVRAQGVECDLQTEDNLQTDGGPADLAVGHDLLGYRVIEAALASAAEHGCRHADIVVAYQPAHLELQIRTDKPLTDLDDRLTGIRDRVALYEGSLQMLSLDGGGSALRARFPLTVPAR